MLIFPSAYCLKTLSVPSKLETFFASNSSFGTTCSLTIGISSILTISPSFLNVKALVGQKYTQQPQKTHFLGS